MSRTRDFSVSAPALAARVLLFATLLVPLIEWGGVYGSSSVPRAVWFRLAVGGAMAILLALSLLRGVHAFDRRDPLLLALIALVAVQTLSALLGEAPARSLWGSLDRMGGVVTWGYLLAYYVALRGFLHGEWWRRFLGASLLVSALAATAAIVEKARGTGTVAILDGRASGTLGNAAFLGAYLLLHLGIGGYLLRDAARRERVAIAAVLVLVAGGFVASNTLSAWLGLALGLAWVAAVALVRVGGRRAWVAALLLAGALSGGAALSALAPASPLVQAVPPLRRLAGLDLSAPTLSGRFALWGPALEGFADAPLLGVGPENYAIVFSRAFTPDMYELFPITSHADRAHNAFLETLATTGALGLLAYLAVWVAYLYQSWRAARAGRLDGLGAAVLAAAGMAYMVYLFFWFEDLSSAATLVALGAFLSSRASGAPLLEVGSRRGDRSRILVAALAVLVVGLVSHQRGVRLLLAARDAAGALRSDRVEERFELYDRSLRRGLPEAAKVAQFQTASLEAFTPRLGALRGDPYRTGVVDRALRSALGHGARVLALEPSYDLWRVERSGTLRFAAFFHRDPRFLQAAIEEIRTAIRIAPGRIRYHHLLADAYLTAGRPDSAMAILTRLERAHPGFRETNVFLAKTHYAMGEYEAADAALVRWTADRNVHQRGHLGLYAQVAAAQAERGRDDRAAWLYLEYLGQKYGFHLRARRGAVAHPMDAADRAIAGRLPIFFLRAGDGATAVAVATRLADVYPAERAAMRSFVEDVRAGRAEGWRERAGVLGGAGESAVREAGSPR